MNKVHVKRDDTVIVLSGDDKGKKGKVVEVSPKEGKVIVNGVHVVSKHTKPRKQGEAGGIVKVEGAIYCPTLPAVTEQLRQIVRPGDVVITMGAGDIFRAGEALLEEK